MSSPPKIPDHTLFGRIGRGAYGEVWLARNVMGTLRAVKVIWRGQFENARPFEREFTGIQRYEPVSRSSGGLVHVLQVGRNDVEGYFYYVMELADDAQGRSGGVMEKGSDGNTADPQHAKTPILPQPEFYLPRTLRTDLKRLGRLPTADCLRLAIDVASGLGQLHRHGLVHRDVKPGNIIYVSGRAKLADIGLVTTEGEGRTFVGTEGYIPPEGPGSPAADLYALGIVLYEASTGWAAERLPDVPSAWFTDAAGDDALELHEVILKATEGQRERRYADVDALQADLALLQSGQSVRRVRALERHYARLRLSGFVGTTLLAGALVIAFFANYRARLAAESQAKESALRREAQQSQARAENAEREARRELQAALYEQARALVLSKELGHRARALEAIRGAAGATNAAELRRVAFAALGLPDLRLEREVALPPDFTLAQTDARFERIALSREGAPVTICSLPDLRPLQTLPASTTNDATVARWSADGRFLAVKRQDPADNALGDLEAWDVSRSRLLFRVQRDVSVNAFCHHPRQPWLLAALAGGALKIWDLETAAELRSFHLPGRTYALAYSPDGNRVAAAYRRGSEWLVALHDATTGALLRATPCPDLIVTIAWHRSGQWVSAAGYDATEWNRGVRLIDVNSGAVTLLGRHKIKTADLAFSPDGKYLMSCGWERELLCWDLRSGQRVFTAPGAGNSLDWDTDGNQCAMVLRSGKFQSYAFDRPACVEVSGNRGEQLRPGAFSPDGRRLVLPDNQNLCLWDLSGDSAPALLADKGLWQPFFSADGTELFAVCGSLGEARLQAWRLAGASGGEPPVASLTVATPPKLNWAAPAGNELALTFEEGVRFLSQPGPALDDGRTEKINSGRGTVSPGGKWLAVTYRFSPRVTIYHLPEVRSAAELDTAGLVDGVWFAPGDDELTVINRGGIEWWDTATWRCKRHEAGTPVSGSYVLYTPDGRSFWRVTNFRDATLYDRNSFEPILPLPPNVLPLALSPEGRRLAVSVDDRRIQVWDLVELRARLRELGLDW